jgi:hypothetical protein
MPRRSKVLLMSSGTSSHERRGLLGGADEVVDVVEVDLGQHRRAPGRHRAGEEVVERLEAEVAHPLRLVLVLGDLLDELRG